jgi:hypothetical protein
MPTRAIAVVLVLLLSNAPAATARPAANDPAQAATAPTARNATPTPIADAGAQAAQATPDTSARRGVSAEWHMATAALLIGGAGVTIHGARARDGCFAYREYDTCGDFRRKYYVAGGALLAAGGTMLVLGERRTSRRRTSVGVDDGRLTLQHRVGF